MTEIKGLVDEIEALKAGVCAPWRFVEGEDYYYVLDARGIAPMGKNTARGTWAPADHVQRYLTALVTHWPTLKEKLESLASDNERLTEIDAAVKADAKDLALMRDGTKLSRAGLVSMIVYQQQDIAAAESRADLAEKANGELRSALTECVRVMQIDEPRFNEWHDAIADGERTLSHPNQR